MKKYRPIELFIYLVLALVAMYLSSCVPCQYRPGGCGGTWVKKKNTRQNVPRTSQTPSIVTLERGDSESLTCQDSSSDKQITSMITTYEHLHNDTISTKKLIDTLEKSYLQIDTLVHQKRGEQSKTVESQAKQLEQLERKNDSLAIRLNDLEIELKAVEKEVKKLRKSLIKTLLIIKEQ